jgi:molecular chaperone DnaJ
LEVRVTITLRDAAFGASRPVRIQRREACNDCGGSGAAPGSQPQQCGDCGGSGQVRQAQGFFSITQACRRCGGRGWLVLNPCKKCRGAGRVEVQREISVDIPAGVDTGSRLRLTGEGEPGDNGGPRGDLYIFIQVEQDDIFTREGNDILCEIPVSFPDAVLGTTVRVPALKGEADLKVPPGTQSGQMFRLRGLGLPDVRGYRKGDEIVRVAVETPTKLNREQKDIIKRFQQLTEEKNYPAHRRFVQNLKKWLGGAGK